MPNETNNAIKSESSMGWQATRSSSSLSCYLKRMVFGWHYDSLRKHYEKMPQSLTEMFHKRPSEIVVSRSFWIHNISGYWSTVTINALLISCKSIESAQKTRECNTDTFNVFLNAILVATHDFHIYIVSSLACIPLPSNCKHIKYES